MAGDPARAKKRTPVEARRELQAECRQKPCRIVEGIVAKTETRLPPCVLCVHERAVMNSLKEVKR